MTKHEQLIIFLASLADYVTVFEAYLPCEVICGAPATPTVKMKVKMRPRDDENVRCEVRLLKDANKLCSESENTHEFS